MPSVGQKYKPTSIINTVPIHKQNGASPNSKRGGKNSEPQTKLNERPAQSSRNANNNSSSRTASLLSHAAATAATLNKDSVIISAADLNHIKSLHSSPNKRSDPSPAALQGAGTAIAGGSASGRGKGSVAELFSPGGSASPAGSREAQLARARARKEYMLRLEQERKQQSGGDDAVGNTGRGGGTSGGAALGAGDVNGTHEQVQQHINRVQDEEHDDVKNMNQMMLYAKCVTIRDAQILEKKLMQAELEKEEKRLDEQMEVDRVRSIKIAEENERRREKERREGAKVVVQQIAQREEERLKAQEIREQEAQAMLARIQLIVVKEEEERLLKVEAGRRLLTQVMQDNNAQARAKLRKKQEELDEDARIAAYIKQKETREAEVEAEQARVSAEKEKDVARLRAQQERIQDRQSQIDELRAKRYQEAKDRKWRDEQLALAEKKEAARLEIARIREQQHIEKEKRLADQARSEKEEYLAMVNSTKGITDEEVWRIENGRKKRAEHRAQLLAQMDAHDKKRHLERKKYLEEADVFAKQFNAEKARLEAVKQEKLRILEKAGVPPKYRAELSKKQILVAKIH